MTCGLMVVPNVADSVRMSGIPPSSVTLAMTEPTCIEKFKTTESWTWSSRSGFTIVRYPRRRIITR